MNGTTPQDPGLQAERTALAWSRTGLALGANGLLACRAGMVGPRPLALLLGGLLLAAAVVVMVGGTARRRRLARGDVRAVSPVMAAGVVAACLLACLAAVAPRLH